VGNSVINFEPNPAKSFSRGGSTYLFDGKRAGVASFDTPKALGESIGRVVKLSKGRFMVDSTATLATGDGVCFIANGEAVGTNINAVDGQWITPNRTDGIAVGTEIYRNYDRLFSLSVERSRIRRAIEAQVTLSFTPSTITATATDCTGISVTTTLDYATDEAKNSAKMESVIREQMSKSGDTIFDITAVEITSLRFVPASVVAQLRRTLLELLESARVAAHTRPKLFVENIDAPYHKAEVNCYDNVTNALSRAFYIDHGAESIAEAVDSRQSTVGCRVMITDYCIRREIGQCLLKNPTIKGELYLERGRKRYKLTFDCKRCQMSLTDTI
jgi:putative protease